MSKIIVITGAGVGLGRALARRFVADGDKVVVLGRTFSKIEAVAKELGEDKALAIECDVGSPDSVRTAFSALAKRHPKIDVLINNAAVFEPFTIVEAKDSQILDSIATNLAGPILCARAAIPIMGPGAHIINVSSESVETMFPHLLLYQTTKAGLERFTLGLRQELEPVGIRVTNVRAGQMAEPGKKWDIDPEAAKKFAQACMDAGINLMTRPISQFASITHVFRMLVDSPADMQVATVTLHARKPD